MATEPRTLRVLQICHDYEGPFRAVCYQYTHAFKQHHVTTVYVCGDADQGVIDATGGDEVIFFGQSTASMRGIKFRTIFKMAALFRRHRFDVVIAHRYKPIYFAGVMSYFFDIPVLLAVAHEHDVFRRPTRKLLITFWCRNIICVGVSDSVSRNIEQYCGPLRQSNRLFTLPHALDLRDESQLLTREAARADFKIPDGEFCFGTVGRLVEKKDHEVLLQAFARCRQADPEFKATLMIIGSGPRDAALKALATALDITASVRFTGHVKDAWRFLRALDVFVLPSGSMEAFGIVLLEAMLARLPIVSSDAPGPKEVIGEAALSFETGDPAALAIEMARTWSMSATQLAELAEAGHERLNQHFTLASFDQNVWALPMLRTLAGQPD